MLLNPNLTKIFILSSVLGNLKSVNTISIIRQLVEKAIYIKQLTPEIEKEINEELTRLGYISDVDYEALELLMDELDAGRIHLVPNLP